MNSHHFAGLFAGDKNVLPGFIRPFRRAAVLALTCLMAGSVPLMNVKGPLITGAADVCTVQPPRGMAAIGHIVHNTGPAALTLTDVSLIGAENLNLRAAYVLPISDQTSYILGTGTSEPEQEEAIAAWDSMTAAESFNLAAGSSANIVVVLDTGQAQEGTSRGLRIVYEQNSTEFASNASSAMTVAGRCF